MNKIANIVTWVLMENIKFNRGLRQTLVLILHFQPPIGSLGTTVTVFIPRGTSVAGEWEIGRHDQNQWVNPYPHHLSPSTLWLLLATDADEMLRSHHPDPHLYLWSRHDSCCGCDVQPPLPKVYKGIVAPVFCLDEAVIDLLSQQTTKQTNKQKSTRRTSSECSQPQTLGRARSSFMEADILHFLYLGWREVHSQRLQRGKICRGAVTPIAGFGNSLFCEWKIGNQSRDTLAQCSHHQQVLEARQTHPPGQNGPGCVRRHLQSMYSKDKLDCSIVKKKHIMTLGSCSCTALGPGLVVSESIWDISAHHCSVRLQHAHGIGRSRASGLWCCSIYSEMVMKVPALTLPPSRHRGLDDNGWQWLLLLSYQMCWVSRDWRLQEAAGC